MLHQEFEAPEALRDTIRCFWYNKRESGGQPTAFEVVPDGYAEIIFHFGGDCSIHADDGLQSLPSPFLVGLLNQPAVFYSRNILEVIGIRCYPWTVFDLLGLPVSAGGLHVFEHPVARLQPALAGRIAAGQATEAIAIVQQYFLDARSEVAADSLLARAGEAMRAAGGTLPVREVAASAHATVRTLERRFKQAAGQTVKDVSGLMRFERVRNHLWHHPDAGIAGLALEMGYTDQSHLSREFRRYSGTSPAAFARKAKQEGLMAGANFVAFVQA